MIFLPIVPAATPEAQKSMVDAAKLRLPSDVNQLLVQKVPQISELVVEQGKATTLKARLEPLREISPQSATDTDVKKALREVATVFQFDLASLKLAEKPADLPGGIRRFKYTQMKDNLPVVGGDILTLIDRNGTTTVRGIGVAERVADRKPAKVAEIKPEVAKTKAAEGRGGATAIVGEPALKYLVSARDHLTYFTYEVKVEGTEEGRHLVENVYVDAITGKVVEARPLRVPLAEVQVWSDANKRKPLGTRISASDLAVDQQADANHRYMSQARDLLGKFFDGRDSYDGKGAPLRSSIHYAKDENNAYWEQASSSFLFGDGDGQQFSHLALAPDVTAHELMHAVTSATSELTGNYEPGAINESISDIFAVLFEAGLYGENDPRVWQIAESVYTPGRAGDALRYVNDPLREPEGVIHYDDRYRGENDHGGVHRNVGIGNYAFYLLARGGTHPKSQIAVRGIGLEKAATIFCRANLDLLTSVAWFGELRSATIQIASARYSAHDVDSVEAAWNAVGVK